MNTAKLHDKIAHVAPIFGVSIGTPDDKSTWSVDFDPAATVEQMQAAAAVVASFDPNAPDVPSQVTPYQARMALLNAGMIDAVDSLMANPETPRAAKLAWEYATVVERQSPFVESLGATLGLSEAQIDGLFAAAAQL